MSRNALMAAVGTITLAVIIGGGMVAATELNMSPSVAYAAGVGISPAIHPLVTRTTGATAKVTGLDDVGGTHE